MSEFLRLFRVATRHRLSNREGSLAPLSRRCARKAVSDPRGLSRSTHGRRVMGGGVRRLRYRPSHPAHSCSCVLTCALAPTVFHPAHSATALTPGDATSALPAPRRTAPRQAPIAIIRPLCKQARRGANRLHPAGLVRCGGPSIESTPVLRAAAESQHVCQACVMSEGRAV